MWYGITAFLSFMAGFLVMAWLASSGQADQTIEQMENDAEFKARENILKTKFALALEYAGLGLISANVTDIKYNEKENCLEVYSHTPGIIIGKQGQIIDKIKELVPVEIKLYTTKLVDWSK